MNKQFAMSKFATMEHLYHAKAEYWEKVARELAEYLVSTEDLRVHPDGYYCWTYSGEPVGEES